MEYLLNVHGVNYVLFFCCFFIQTLKTKARPRNRIPVDNTVLIMILFFALDFLFILAPSPLSTTWQRKTGVKIQQ
jgi:hypothetical protein